MINELAYFKNIFLLNELFVNISIIEVSNFVVFVISETGFPSTSWRIKTLRFLCFARLAVASLLLVKACVLCVTNNISQKCVNATMQL